MKLILYSREHSMAWHDISDKEEEANTAASMLQIRWTHDDGGIL